jgi:hypothetical protein
MMRLAVAHMQTSLIQGGMTEWLLLVACNSQRFSYQLHVHHTDANGDWRSHDARRAWTNEL